MATLIDLTVPTTVTDPTTGAIFSTNFATVGAGTGLIDPFSQIQGKNGDSDGLPGTEQGYNTNFNDFILENAGKGGTNFIHALRISDLPIEFIDPDGAGPLPGVGYYRFELDIDESNNAANHLLSLDAIQVWQATSGDLSNYVPTATPDQGTGFFPAGSATKIFDLDNRDTDHDGVFETHLDRFIGLDGNLQPGSGKHVDASFLIPIADFDTSKPFIYLYSAFGYQTGTFQGSTWTAESGFEE